jgi:Protein of unknown function (DUF4232)
MAHRQWFGIATLAAVSLAGCASTIPSPSPTATRPPSPTPSLVVTRGCVASDFKVGNGASGAYQGDAVYSMALLNMSGAGCALNGAPPITLTLESGAQESVALGDAASMAVDIGPGQILQIMVGTPGNCATPGIRHAASSLTVLLPGGSLIDHAVNLDTECGTPSVLIFTAVNR